MRDLGVPAAEVPEQSFGRSGISSRVDKFEALLRHAPVEHVSRLFESREYIIVEDLRPLIHVCRTGGVRGLHSVL